MKLSDQKLGDVFHTIAKGEHGTGKSILLASYAAAGPMYIFDFEDRMRSVKNYYLRIGRPDIINNIDFDTYTSFHKVRKKLESIESNPRGIINVGWDSLTSFTKRALSNTKEFKQDAQEQSGQKVGKTVGEFRVNSIEDYNAETAAIDEFVIEHALILKGMKINFILTAHVIKVKEEDENHATHIARYLMTGGKKAAQIVPGYYDEIYHTNVEAGMSVKDAPKYTVRTRHSINDFAKTALNLPVTIDFTDKVFYEELVKHTPKLEKPQTPGLITEVPPFRKDNDKT